MKLEIALQFTLLMYLLHIHGIINLIAKQFTKPKLDRQHYKSIKDYTFPVLHTLKGESIHY